MNPVALHGCWGREGSGYTDGCPVPAEGAHTGLAPHIETPPERTALPRIGFAGSHKGDAATSFGHRTAAVSHSGCAATVRACAGLRGVTHEVVVPEPRVKRGRA